MAEASDQPPQGIYLDAILANNKARVLDDISVTSRTRRRHQYAVAAAVAVSLVAGTAGAAITIVHPWTVKPSAHTLYQLYCTEGYNLNGVRDLVERDAYYQASFYYPNVASSPLTFDAVAACQTAWNSPATITGTGADSYLSVVSPTVLFHTPLLTNVSWKGNDPDKSGYGSRIPPMASCTRPDARGAAVYVISAGPGETTVSPRQWESRCEANPGFVLDASSKSRTASSTPSLTAAPNPSASPKHADLPPVVPQPVNGFDPVKAWDVCTTQLIAAHPNDDGIGGPYPRHSPEVVTTAATPDGSPGITVTVKSGGVESDNPGSPTYTCLVIGTSEHPVVLSVGHLG